LTVELPDLIHRDFHIASLCNHTTTVRRRLHDFR
jgi:hypothetical protein